MHGHESMRTGDDLHVSIDLTAPETPRRESDPLRGMSPRALQRLARRADRYRRRDVAKFERVAREHHITVRRMRMLADAWAEAGPVGVDALAPARPADPVLMARAEEVIETWRRRHFPLDRLETEIWRNRLNVWWMRPNDEPTGELVRHPLMQLRRTDDGRWHLYRRAVQGEWWPVVVRGRRRRQSLSACLDAVRVDPLHHFWGHGGPPTDLAVGDALPDWPLS